MDARSTLGIEPSCIHSLDKVRCTSLKEIDLASTAYLEINVSNS